MLNLRLCPTRLYARGLTNTLSPRQDDQGLMGAAGVRSGTDPVRTDTSEAS